MQSKAATVAEYLASLPHDRRVIIDTVRATILKNLDKDIEEGMQYGMIGYFVPHRVFPEGYHCDPKQPLPYAGLASQKQGISLYFMSLYTGGGPAHDHLKWFQGAWADAVTQGRAKKLDMGKACIRFKSLQDIPLDVIGETVRRVSAKTYINAYVASRGDTDRSTPIKKSTLTKKPAPTKNVAIASNKPTRQTAATTSTARQTRAKPKPKPEPKPRVKARARQ